MTNIMNTIFEWVWNLSPVLTICILAILGILAIYGKRLAFVLFKNTLGRKHALEAVRGAEKLVFLLGKEKFLLAVQHLNSEIKKRFKISVPNLLLEKWVDWAYQKMVKNGEEIKANSVLSVPKEQFRFDVKKLSIRPKGNGFKATYGTTF